MALTEKDIERIEQYLLGELNRKEEKEIEERMVFDTEFADEVTFMRNVVSASKNEAKQEARNKLKSVENELAGKLETQADEEMQKEKGIRNNKILNIRRNWMYYAASLALLVAVGLYLNQTRGSRDLYEGYFSPHPNTLISYARGSDVPQEFSRFSRQEYNLIVRAMKHYENGNYAKAARLFEQNVEVKPENAGLIFYMAVSQLGADKTAKAINNLSFIKELDQAPYRAQISWYLALAYLKDNQTEKAKDLLGNISNASDHPHQDKAKELLKKLTQIQE